MGDVLLFFCDLCDFIGQAFESIRLPSSLCSFYDAISHFSCPHTLIWMGITWSINTHTDPHVRLLVPLCHTHSQSKTRKHAGYIQVVNDQSCLEKDKINHLPGLLDITGYSAMFLVIVLLKLTRLIITVVVITLLNMYSSFLHNKHGLIIWLILVSFWYMKLKFEI